MAPDPLALQPEGLAEHPHLVLEELPEGLQELQAHPVGQASDVVVGLDGRRGSAVGRDALDHVRVQGALGEPPGSLHGLRRVLEHLDEDPTDDLSLRLGLFDPRQGGQEALAGVHVHEVDAFEVLEVAADLLGLLVPQQPVVDEDAGAAFADGPGQQGRDHRGVDASGEPQDHVVVAHLGADPGHLLLDEVPHRPVRLAAALAEHEVLDELAASSGVHHLRVELHADEAIVCRDHRRAGRVRGAGGHPEALGELQDPVPVGHPHRLESLEHAAVAEHLELREPELPVGGRLHLSPEQLGEQLHAVADPQDRHPEVDLLPIDVGRPLRVHRGGAPGEHQAGDLFSLFDHRGLGVGPDLAVDVGFADATSDQLGVLGSEVENQDLLAGHELPGRLRARGLARHHTYSRIASPL